MKSFRGLWEPDLYIMQAIRTASPVLEVPTNFLRIYNDSRIYLSKRSIVDLGCQMTFEDYPVDVQDCPVRFESFSMPEKIMDVKLDLKYTVVSCEIVLNQHTYSITLNNSLSKEYLTGESIMQAYCKE